MKRLKMCAMVASFAMVAFFSQDTLPDEKFQNRHAGIKKAEELVMVLGEQEVIEARDIASFSESTRGVIEVKIPREGRKMIITALKTGTTSLLLIDHSGEEHTVFITVFAQRPETIIGELKALLTGIENIGFRRVGPRIFIDGTVSSDADRTKVKQVVKVYRGQVASLVTVDAEVVLPQTNIRLDLAFVGLRRRSGYRAGISWPDAYGASGALEGSVNLLTGSLSASYQVVDQALPALEMAARHGWARIRKRATVLTTSGNKATYEAGGEVNIAVAGSQAAELRTVPYGARLSVLPRLAKGRDILDLDIEAEVSDLTETTQNVPGRSISRVKTTVHLGLGQSILLGGLDFVSESRTKSGLPGLSRIPIFGLFFGTNSHQDDQEEGIIAVTPTVIDTVDQEGRRLLEEALKKFETFDGDF
ncbi:MAG: pilus assembly protein N-terminal domain-containing protein [Myxococcota bacterium]|nr:pilus assembly protein N-terminal domain-containing protein [Myxococcota bacterium]